MQYFTLITVIDGWLWNLAKLVVWHLTSFTPPFSSHLAAVRHEGGKKFPLCRSECRWPCPNEPYTGRVLSQNIPPTLICFCKPHLVDILALMSQYQINTDDCTHVLLNHHFINTVRNPMFQPLKSNLQGCILASWVNKMSHHVVDTSC
jgi:hypothetical protein